MNASRGLISGTFSDCHVLRVRTWKAKVVGEVADTAGFDHFVASVNGAPRAYTVRAKEIYRREDGQWMVVHQHGSGHHLFDATPQGQQLRQTAADVHRTR